MESALRKSREELRDLSMHLQTVREEERGRIAREVHDELGQALTAVKMDAAWLSRKASKSEPFVLEKLKSITDVIDSTIQTVKRISSELRPGLLDDLGLGAAIDWQTKEFQNRTGVECDASIYPDDITLNTDLSTALFRIFQEALTNIARHAHATKVAVNLQKKDGEVTMRVEDNGRGITKRQIDDPRSFGLIGIRERARFLGGKVELTGKRGRGTTLEVSIPSSEKGEV
jgi:signal transduction histidine kinase